ncbi:MAG: internal scaffolding protein [Microvirus sp.]|nr:MAG: internal scaffolding protein [Microvirus sp.]
MKSKVMVRIVDSYDSDGTSLANAIVCPEESLTRQEFKSECDINTIIDQFGIGENPITQQEWIQNIDISESVCDYQTALNQIIEAQQQFASLPAKVRSRFDNDAAKFVDFVSDESNGSEMVQLGLAVLRPDFSEGKAGDKAPGAPSGSPPSQAAQLSS